MTVESVDDEFPVAAEHLCRGDEVVAVDGEPIAIRDDPQYDSRCRKAAFAALKSRIAKAPRPVTLGFVRGDQYSIALALVPSMRLATRRHSGAGVCCLVGCAAWCAALQRLEPDTWRARGVGLKRREEP